MLSVLPNYAFLELFGPHALLAHCEQRMPRSSQAQICDRVLFTLEYRLGTRLYLLKRSLTHRIYAPEDNSSTVLLHGLWSA